MDCTGCRCWDSSVWRGMKAERYLFLKWCPWSPLSPVPSGCKKFESAPRPWSVWLAIDRFRSSSLCPPLWRLLDLVRLFLPDFRLEVRCLFPRAERALPYLAIYNIPCENKIETGFEFCPKDKKRTCLQNPLAGPKPCLSTICDWSMNAAGMHTSLRCARNSTKKI